VIVQRDHVLRDGRGQRPVLQGIGQCPGDCPQYVVGRDPKSGQTALVLALVSYLVARWLVASPVGGFWQAIRDASALVVLKLGEPLLGVCANSIAGHVAERGFERSDIVALERVEGFAIRDASALVVLKLGETLLCVGANRIAGHVAERGFERSEIVAF